MRAAALLLVACTPAAAPAPPAPIAAPIVTHPVDDSFWVALDLDGLRGMPAGAKVLASLDRAGASTNERLGFAPLEEATWVVFGGPRPAVMGPGAFAVVAHGKSETEAARIVSRAGGADGRATLYGVTGTLRTERGVIVFAPPNASVPAEARRTDETAKLRVARLDAGWWRPELGEVVLVARRAGDGLDVEGTAACPDDDTCRAIGRDFRARVHALDENARGVTRGAFVPLESEPGLRADGRTLRARLHLDAEQLRVLTELALAWYGLP